MKQGKKEQDRQQLLNKAGNTPAQNPFYRGKTPVEVVRILLRSKKPK